MLLIASADLQTHMCRCMHARVCTHTHTHTHTYLLTLWHTET